MPRVIEVALRFPIDRLLADGVLFAPYEMEYKWAVFYHQRQIICARSWVCQVLAAAQVLRHGGHVEITAVRGKLVSEDEDPSFTIRVVDYLVRSHALDAPHPAPLRPGLEQDPEASAT